jgi:hypothetical protein
VIRLKAELHEQEAPMLEFMAIAIAVVGAVAIIGAEVGRRLGAKRAVREIVRVFQREIVSNDDERCNAPTSEQGRNQNRLYACGGRIRNQIRHQQQCGSDLDSQIASFSFPLRAGSLRVSR